MCPYDESTCLAWLSGAGLSPEMEQSLLEGRSGRELYDAFLSGDREGLFSDLPAGMLKGLRKNAGSDWLERTQSVMRSLEIAAFTIFDAVYPQRLRDIDCPPAVLFCQGDASCLGRRSVSVVGSRRASLRGLRATERICAGISEKGVTVVSGLAYGVDASAHEGCLKGGSPTVAVLGCGNDVDYPAENATLKREILKRGGLILSEYPPGEKPLGWHFPFRNRIISALGECLIVMEARIKSGSLTTVRHALDQGKDVFVYPGDPDSASFEGNHLLLREGAAYFTRAEDILEDMNWLDKSEEVRQNSDCAGNEASLTTLEKEIMKALDAEDLSFDQLCTRLHRDAPEMMGTLTMMQLKGMIEAMPGKTYHLDRE